jgi:hypothetical protein
VPPEDRENTSNFFISRKMGNALAKIEMLNFPGNKRIHIALLQAFPGVLNYGGAPAVKLKIAKSAIKVRWGFFQLEYITRETTNTVIKVL